MSVNGPSFLPNRPPGKVVHAAVKGFSGNGTKSGLFPVPCFLVNCHKTRKLSIPNKVTLAITMKHAQPPKKPQSLSFSLLFLKHTLQYTLVHQIHYLLIGLASRLLSKNRAMIVFQCGETLFLSILTRVYEKPR